MRTLEGIESRRVLEVTVDATSYEDATTRVLRWAKDGESRYVCVCNVHMVMEAHNDPSFRDVVNGADLVTPDGMPLVWMLKALGVQTATRVYGPDLTLGVCETAAAEGIPVGLYGSETRVLELLAGRLRQHFPRLELVFQCAPPVGPAMPVMDDIAFRASGARVLFVALGCPKQERWMAEHRGRVPAVMLGVGAAFDFLAGTKWQAPRSIQRAGLEWAFRLITEPRRLGRRYASTNPRFAALALRQWLAHR